MDKFLGFIGLIVAMIVIGIPMTFLKAHILMDVSTLWELSFITSLGFTKIVGLMSVLTIYTLKTSDKEEKKHTISEAFIVLLSKSFGISFLLLGGWAMSYLIHIFV